MGRMSVMCLVLLLGASVAGCAAAAGTESNPLLETGRFPRWSEIKPEHVQPAVKQLLQEESASLDLLEKDLEKATKDGTLTFDRVFLPYQQIQLRMDAVFSQIEHLSSTMDSPAMRAAIDAIAPSRTEFLLRLGQSKAIYNAANALQTTPALWDKLNPVQQRIVSQSVRDFKNSGVGLSPEKRVEFNGIIEKLRALSTNYTNNVLDSTKAFKMLIKDKAKLAGMESSVLAVAAQKAKAAGHKDATTQNGPWLLTIDTPTYQAVVGFAKDRELRKKIYTAYRSIASSGKSDNTAYIKDTLYLRKKLVELLGYKNYADYAFASKMATFKEADDLLQQMVKDSRPAALREDAELTAFARNATGDPKLKLLWWDIPFWSERMKEARFQVKREELREYLPLDSVMQGLFKLANRLYGVDIKLLDKQPPVWHKDVQVYGISNAGSNQPFAYFYTDLYSRPGLKQQGGWMQSMWDAAAYRRAPSPAAQAVAEAMAGKTDPASKAAAASPNFNASSRVVVDWTPSLQQQTLRWLTSAPKQLPIAVVVSNQDPPADGKPSLMTLGDAETLFHEFGHALQHLLTTATPGLVSGMRSIEWDAVETPSQMQEKWVYDKKTFNSFAKHWKTGQPVPASMFDKVKNLQKYRAGNGFTYQLVLGLTDLKLHSSFDPNGTITPIQVQHDYYKQIMPIAPNPADRQLNNFGHIFSGGYSAGYYSYMWADVMSADAYEAFEEAGMDNEAAIEKLGRKFRSTFLASGGAIPPGQVFKNFRGRAPKVEPLLKYNGLIK